MNLFVFGVGYSVSHFIHTYGERFARISGTCRSPEKARQLRTSGIEPYLYDGAVHDSVLVDALAKAHALLISVPPGSGPDPIIQDFENTIAAAPNLRWIGYLSTIGVHGDANGAWVDEETPPNPHNERSRRRLDAERQWLSLGERLQVPVQVFRLAGIYGPGRNPLSRVVEGTARRIVKPGQVFNRIHVDDIAQVLMASLDHRPSRSRIYNVTDDEPAPPQDVIAYAAKLLGREPPPEEPFDGAALDPMSRSFYEDNKRVRNTRIKEELGVALRFPTYREGLQALYADGEGRV